MNGHVDVISENSLAGWAIDPLTPDQPTRVNVFIQDALVATVVASHYRPDLAIAGIGDGKKAFAFNPGPFIRGENQRVRVAFATTGETLVNGRGDLHASRVKCVEDWDTFYADTAPPLSGIARITRFPKGRWPLISVVMPTYNTPIQFLRAAIESVIAQEYPHWELCISDDCSPDAAVRDWIRHYVERDSRVKASAQPKNSGISTATNAAIFQAAGEFIAFLDHDDELTPDALAEVAAHILEQPTADIVYTDQEKHDADGRTLQRFHKPAWSPVYLCGAMYVGHLLVCRASLVRDVGGCDKAYDKVQDFELMLRLGRKTKNIHHIPKALYRWRSIPGSIAESASAKGDIADLQVAAANTHLRSLGVAARVLPHPAHHHRTQIFPTAPRDDVSVSIIIPTRDAPEHIGRCLESIFARTTHKHFEVILVDNGTTNPEALAVFNHYPVRRLVHDGVFNFSRVNNEAVKHARGDVVVLLNNDTEVITHDWLQLMIMHLEFPNVGAVGAKLLYPSGKIQHAGVVLGLRGTVDHIMRGFEPEWDGYAGSLACSREVSAVTAACLAIRKDTYEAMGGLDEAYASIYQDADLCLRILETGRTVLYAANVSLFHHESMTRGVGYNLIDRALFIDRWRTCLEHGDAYYNPHFTRNRDDYTLRTLSFA
ncbi:MAG: glycosyltransferase family 2 protein [Opitutaceae bacterium]